MKLTKQLLFGLIASTITHGLATAQDKSDSAFKPSGNVYGYVFGDYAYKMNNDTLQRGGGNVQYKGTGPLSSNNVTGNTNVPANVQTSALAIRN